MESEKNPRQLFNELENDEQQLVADFFSLHAVATRLYNNLSDHAKELIDYYVNHANEKVEEVKEV